MMVMNTIVKAVVSLRSKLLAEGNSSFLSYLAVEFNEKARQRASEIDEISRMLLFKTVCQDAENNLDHQC